MSQTKSSSISLSAAAPTDSESKKKAGPLALAGAAGILGSLCCLGPLVAVSLGLGGGVAGTLVAFAPYRPLFIAIALGALGYSGWKIYRRPAVACAPGEVCAVPGANRIYKIIFGIVTAAVLALLASPYYLPLFI
jgi:mercuric ion transport protein